MPEYCINRNQQSNGDYEVHDLTPGNCNHLPNLENRIGLGAFSDCKGAVREAKRRFPDNSNKINGCYYCSRPCHTS